ncbi:MAG: hypothetical protein OXK80_04210 [Bdellovibrionales bacterium]|nr:hypothetical protein [Bdellovibrionales bacterium]
MKKIIKFVLIILNIQVFASIIAIRPIPDKRFTFYPYCFYKNENKEISASEGCLKVHNYFLVVPKGSLVVCYVNASVVELDEKTLFRENLKIMGINTSKKTSSPIFSFFKKEIVDTTCSTLSRSVHYSSVITRSPYNFENIIRDKDALRGFKEHFAKQCPSKYLLYYDNMSKQEKLINLDTGEFIKIREHFQKCN